MKANEMVPELKTVMLDDGIEYKIYYNMKALALLEDRYGSLAGIAEAFAPKPKKDKDGNPVLDKDGKPVLEEKIPMSDLSFIMWCGLRRHAPDITEDYILDNVGHNRMQSVIETCFSAFADSTPMAGEAKKKGKKADQ